MSAYKTTRYNLQQQAQRQPSPSKSYIYSSMCIQDDQKQIIVTKLKEEIAMLKKNQSQFEKMQEHYRGLDHEFNALSQQKKSNDDNFGKHHEAALRHISQIKNQIDAAKAELRDKKLEIQDLKTDENVLKNELDQKYIEIEKLKNDLNSAIADNEELSSEHTKLVQIHQNAVQEWQRRSQESQKCMFDLQSVEKKILEIESYFEQLKSVEKALTDRILNYEEENNKLDGDIAVTIEDLAIIGQNIDESTRKVSELQAMTASVNGQVEKFKSEALHFKKACQAEVMKSKELANSINRAENLLNVRKNQVKEGHRQIESLNQENISLEKINSQLEDDLEACREHLENMALLNSNLVEKMQRISEQDEEARHIIDRKGRVQMASQRVQEAEHERKAMGEGNAKAVLHDTRESSFRSSPYSSRRVMREYL